MATGCQTDFSPRSPLLSCGGDVSRDETEPPMSRDSKLAVLPGKESGNVRVKQLGPPVVPDLSPFFGWEGSPAKIDVQKKNRAPLFEHLSTGGPRQSYLHLCECLFVPKLKALGLGLQAPGPWPVYGSRLTLPTSAHSLQNLVLRPTVFPTVLLFWYTILGGRSRKRKSHFPSSPEFLGYFSSCKQTVGTLFGKLLLNTCT